MQTNEPIYQQSLKEAKAWLDDYFETTNDKVQNMESEISKLLDIRLTVTIPTLQSLTLVQTSGQQMLGQQTQEQPKSVQQTPGQPSSDQHTNKQQSSDHQIIGQ